jgi:glutamate synthase domain-containing protein 1
MLASSDIARLSPICTPDASDSESFDQVLELLHLGGRSLPHAVLMMIPEAWESDLPAPVLPGALPLAVA